MNKFLTIPFLFLTLAFVSSTYAQETIEITNDEVREITTRLQSYSQSELIERQLFLQNELQEMEEGDSPNGTSQGSSRAAILMELSIIEQLLILTGAVLLDDVVNDDDSTPPDTVFPVITINGDNPAVVELGSSYVDAGATSDGGETVTSTGSVDTSTLGTYTITYSATDDAGNTSTATRTVNVVDTTAPVVTLNGSDVTLERGGTYTELGATASDLSGAVSVVVSGTVDTLVAATYTITYSSTDSSGNTGTAVRTVIVQDTITPVVTINPGQRNVEELVAAGQGQHFDLGATAEDFDANGNSLGSVAVVTTGSVDVTTLGTYTLTYTATGASGNAGTATRTISVTDTIAPVVTVNPDQRNVEELIRVGEGSHYDLGATAQDQDAGGNSLGSVSVVTTG